MEGEEVKEGGEAGEGNGVAPTSAFPNGVWERGELGEEGREADCTAAGPAAATTEPAAAAG